VVAAALGDWPDQPGLGWPSWALTNHDSPRGLSRWATPADRMAFARMTMLLLVGLRGNPFLYYGEELGLTQVEIPFEELQDPEAIANWPQTLSRDGARTPMPWEAGAPNAGFTTGRPWLRLGADHLDLAVDRQNADPQSLLNLTRTLLAIRRADPALRLGDLTGLAVDGDLLRFERRHGNRVLGLAFNFGSGTLPAGLSGRLLAAVNGATAETLPPFGAVLVEI
jgi:alpha-glucosidase